MKLAAVLPIPRSLHGKALLLADDGLTFLASFRPTLTLPLWPTVESCA